MTTTNYVAVFPEVRRDDVLCRVHAPGCADIAKALAKNGGFEDAVDLDLDATDHTANMLALDPDQLGYTMDDVVVVRCATNHANRARRAAAKVAAVSAQTPAKPRRARQVPATPAADPQPTSGARRARATGAGRARRNGPAQTEAHEQAEKIIAETTAKVRAAHADPHEEWNAARLATCDDATYALALRVREARSTGLAWWRIAHDMELPGSGPSVAQGKTGAAHARRLWARAWGETYKDTTVPRETKAVKKERALVSPGRPFFPADTPDPEVVSVVRGREITWCTRLKAGDGVVVSLQTAKVHNESIQLEQGPKGRVINFYEVIKDERGSELVGPRRSVYLDRIEKVGA